MKGKPCCNRKIINIYSRLNIFKKSKGYDASVYLSCLWLNSVQVKKIYV